MTKRPFDLVAATLFGLIAVLHLCRLFTGTPVQIGASSVPTWISWLGLIVPGALSVWGFRSAREAG